MPSRDRADSEYVSYVDVDRQGADFIGNEQFTWSLTYRHSTLYNSTDVWLPGLEKPMF